ncbi:MAG: prefoldin subunit beta [Candidatus Woesearchaeota archaeon]
MDNQMQEKIGQIQMIQQNMENFNMQRQQFQLQQTEIDSALVEMDASGETYKIIGNIMVSVNKDKLKKELEEKREMLNIRINSIEKQEEKLRIKFEELQQEVMKGLEDNESKKKTKKQAQND